MVAKSKTIRFEHSGSVGSIVLANAPYNRIDAVYPVALRNAVHEASESDIRVLVVRAEGPNFSLGGERNAKMMPLGAVKRYFLAWRQVRVTVILIARCSEPGAA